MPNDNNSDNLMLSSAGPADDNARTLPKARIDVEIIEQVYYGKPCYVLKDPATLRYYRLRPPEYAIYKMLDGSANVENILKMLSRRFPQEQFDAQAVMNFIIMLRGANLLHISSQDNTDYLLKRKQLMTRNLFQKLKTEFLFFKIPLLDPDKLLNYLRSNIARIIYRRTTAILIWLMLAGALVLLFSNIDKLSQRQPLLSWINLLYLAPSLFVIKIIHEFGHGLTAKHYDVEVHEMGLLFLVFMPCMYCDVSDAWMLSSKKKRMWITAAGIAVEIILAGLATYLWALTVPGSVINQFALNMMLVASVNSILFNGNPLLRYDGYYFLMDLWEIPNLRQKGSGYLYYLLQRFVLGIENASEPIDVKGREFAVVSYAVCSTIYRWFIMIAIITMVWKFLDPYGWGVIGGLMALGSIYTSLFAPIGKAFSFLNHHRHHLHIRPVTTAILATLVIAVIAGILLLPVQQSVDTQCILRPANMQPIYVTQPGFIGQDSIVVRDGQYVQPGQTLLTLSNEQLAYEASDLKLRIEQLDIASRQARRRQLDTREAQINAEIESLQARYAQAKRDLDKLTIKAPAAGIIQWRAAEPPARLKGRFLPLQTEILALYTEGRFEAVAAINNRDIELVEPHQSVKIKLWALDNRVICSSVENKPPTAVIKMSSPAFSTVFGGEVPTVPTAEVEDALEPAQNTYELVLPLDSDPALRDGMIGRAKIIVTDKTLARAFYLWLIRTLQQDIRL
jgi:putative peptide zinc metalloprotease protein